MSHTQSELEFDYLSLACQLEDVLQRKLAALKLDADIREAHQLLVELGKEIASAADAVQLEYDYLAANYKMQDLLQQKSNASHLPREFQALHNRLEALGATLGWNQSPSEHAAGPHHDSERSSRLQQEIQELRAAIH